MCLRSLQVAKSNFLSSNAAFYEYLTEDILDSAFVVVPGPEAVHDMYISNPKAVVDAICGAADLGCDDDEVDEDENDDSD